MAEKNIEAFAARLGDPNLGEGMLFFSLPRVSLAEVAGHAANMPLDPQKKYHLVTELRDGIDFLCAGPSYAIFLKRLVPIFTRMLEGPPAFMSASLEHVGHTARQRVVPSPPEYADIKTYRGFVIVSSKSSTACQ